MRHCFNSKVDSTIETVDLKKNEILVERCGYVPLKTQVERAFSAGAIATMRQKMADPNGQYERIIEDASEVEANFKDNLTLMRFAKEVRERCQAQLNALNQAQIDAQTQKLADADAIIKERQSKPTDIVG